ncbi:MAG: dephospho-CoA kinase [Spirochaetales bacterium]|nr:dephospho-CoA kinase [Spirochaetales bacterium]
MSDPRPVVVGVAGKYCSGKDAVTQWLLARSWREINVDRVGHEALATLHNRIVAAFGRTIVDAHGRIDRSALAKIVFSDRAQRIRLEEIVHPWMRRRVRDEVDAYRDTAARVDTSTRGLVINAALLFYMDLDAVCDAVILVRAPFWVRVGRARARDRSSVWRTTRRLWAQRQLDTQALQSVADTIIVENGGSLESLYAHLGELPQLQ